MSDSSCAAQAPHPSVARPVVGGQIRGRQLQLESSESPPRSLALQAPVLGPSARLNHLLGAGGMIDIDRRQVGVVARHGPRARAYRAVYPPSTGRATPTTRLAP